jgi:acetyl-CoA carboxylase biotin carboxyl carrier protein
MKLKKIRELIRIVEESDIEELDISGFLKLSRVKIVKRKGVFDSHGGTGADAGPPHFRVQHSEHVSAGTDSATPGVPPVDADNISYIVSPMVGTFYRASTPDSEPFVRENQKVTTGEVVCIVEAMKLMNEIESDYSGEIVEILVENGTPVQYNQPLFSIKLNE